MDETYIKVNQQVTFLSDGGDTVRYLQLYLNPQAEHLLDWFHVTMRITVMNQMSKGVKYHDEEVGEEALKRCSSAVAGQDACSRWRLTEYL